MKIIELHLNVIKSNKEDKILCVTQDNQDNLKISIENDENH